MAVSGTPVDAIFGTVITGFVLLAWLPTSTIVISLLGIPTLKDRVCRMALKLVMEPIIESGFYASSYAYRPGRRTQDAIAETHLFTTHSCEWIVETDIEACFDRLPHCLILEEVRRRIVDKRVLALVRLFPKAGLMTETGRLQRTVTGTPQCGESRTSRSAGSGEETTG